MDSGSQGETFEENTQLTDQQRWTTTGTAGLLTKASLMSGDLRFRLSGEGQRYKRVEQSSDWSSFIQVEANQGASEFELRESRTVEFAQRRFRRARGRAEVVVLQIRLRGFGLRAWGDAAHTTALGGATALSTGFGVRYGDDD